MSIASRRESVFSLAFNAFFYYTIKTAKLSSPENIFCAFGGMEKTRRTVARDAPFHKT